MKRNSPSRASVVRTACGQYEGVNFNAAKDILCKSGAVADIRKTLGDPGQRAGTSKVHVASSCADLTHGFRSVEPSKYSTLSVSCSGIDCEGLRNVD